MGPRQPSVQSWAWGCHESPQCTAGFVLGKGFVSPRHGLCSHPPSAVSWQDCIPPGQVPQSLPGLTHRRRESKQGTHYQHVS